GGGWNQNQSNSHPLIILIINAQHKTTELWKFIHITSVKNKDETAYRDFLNPKQGLLTGALQINLHHEK
ncbi:hypothetical protein, partial [Pantoea sp.]